MCNYALERSVRDFANAAAAARKMVVPAAPCAVVPRPAQRGR